jgi:hypothetical protein
VVAAVGWTVLKLLGTWYVTRVVGNATAVYGTFGTVVGVLALLYLASRVFLYGAELNAVLLEQRGKAPWGDAIEPGGVSVARKSEDITPTSSNGTGSGNGNGAASEMSTPELLKNVAGDTATLIRKEVELARHEVVEALVARAKAAGALAAGGLMALFMLVFLGIAGGLALAQVMAAWAAFLIVAGVFLLLAVGAVLFAKLRMKAPPMAPEETKRTVKEDVEWAKAQLRR